MKDRGGFDAKSCRKFGLVPHTLAAILASAVHNIQITMNREMAKHPSIGPQTHQIPQEGGFEPLTSCVSSRRSNQAELTAPSHAG